MKQTLREKRWKNVQPTVQENHKETLARVTIESLELREYTITSSKPNKLKM